MRRRSRWGQSPSVDDPGRAGAVQDHTYATSNGTWQLPKDSEVEPWSGRDPVTIGDTVKPWQQAAERKGRMSDDEFRAWNREQRANLPRASEADPLAPWRRISELQEMARARRAEQEADRRQADEERASEKAASDESAQDQVRQEQAAAELAAELRWAEAIHEAENEAAAYAEPAGADDGYGPGGAADPAWTGEVDSSAEISAPGMEVEA